MKCFHKETLQRYEFLAEFEIYPDGCDMTYGAICCLTATKMRNLYHIATEQGEVISHFVKQNISCLP